MMRPLQSTATVLHHSTKERRPGDWKTPMVRGYDDNELKPRASRRASDESDVEEDAFLDRMSGLLDAIVRECATIGRTEDAGAVLAKAAHAFEGVQRMCREAGIVHADGEDMHGPSKTHPSHAASRVVPVRQHDLKRGKIGSLATVSHELPSRAPQHLSLSLDEAAESRVAEDESEPPQTPLRYRLPLSSGDDIIEVEITDILTSTQEEIQRWKHEFRLQMMDQEAKQYELNQAHMEQIQTLKEALDDSHRHISKLHRTIQDTNDKLESMQALTVKSQKAMELTLKEHSQYWKAMCHDLVVEKRTIAKKLAEERGKYHSLREHIDMHDFTGKPSGESTQTRRSSPLESPVKTRHSASEKSKRSLEAPHTHTAHNLSSYAADSPPQHSSFRRYYLTKKATA